MRRRIGILLLLLVVSLCLWSSAADVHVTHAAGQELATVAILSGGGYRLTVVAWQSPPVAQSERYIVLAPTVRPAEATLTGNGCCCIYLPCIRR